MSVHRQAPKRDKAEKPIISALRHVGATVEQLSIPVGPDLMAGYRGVNYLLEVKTGKRKLRPGQIEWHESWQGQVAVVRSVDEALQVIGAIGGNQDDD